MVDVDLRTLTALTVAGEPDAHARFCAVDELAFGAHNDASYVEAKRRIVDPDRFVLAIADEPSGEVDVGTGPAMRSTATRSSPRRSVGPTTGPTLVLGDGSFRALARIGRVYGPTEPVALADALFAADPPPWTDTRF